MAAELPLSATVKFNPHLWGPEELRAIFVVRTRELAELLEAVRASPAGVTPQHILITGSRGMGKSTLLRRLALAVEDDPALSAHWLPLSFPEEQYTVGTLAELWRNCLDALADTWERQGAPAAELARLDTEIQRLGTLPAAVREPAALDCLQTWIATHQRRLLLLIDSTDLLFDGLAAGSGGARGQTDGGATPLWRLRKTLSHEPGLFWLGASFQALESHNAYQDAFLDFFRLVELRPPSLEEMRRALLALARTFGAGRGLKGDAAEREMTRALDQRPERLKSLRALTGGNPRTTVMLYELFAAGGDDDVHSDLRRLLDTLTPLYKARLESLSDQARKLLAHVMEYWAPISARELGEVAGIVTGTVSGQLSRLEAEGLIEKTALPGTRRTGFQVAERLFNVWYLMRYASRRLRQRLTWLVEFMRLWYGRDELVELARGRSKHHTAGRLYGRDQLEWSRALAFALPEDHQDRYRLDWAVDDAARRSAEDRAALGDLFDLEGEDREYTTAEDYLTRFEALDAPLGRCPWVTKATRGAWIAAVKGSLGLSLAEKEAVAQAAAGLDEAQYRERLQALEDEQQRWAEAYGGEAARALRQAVLKGDFFPDCPDPKLAYQQLLGGFGDQARAFGAGLRFFRKRHRDAWVEKAYRRALQLDAGDSELWWGLATLLHLDLHRPEEAEAAYRQAIALDPKAALAALPWNNLGNLLANQLHRPEEAEAAYRQAMTLDPSAPYPAANLARLLAAAGRRSEADAAYRQAAGQIQARGAADTGPDGYAHLLLQAHLWLGNRDLAKQALERLAQPAAAGDQWAFFRLREQTRECHAIGLGPALRGLMDASAWAGFLQPFALALEAAARGDQEPLAGAPPELRTLAEEVLAELRPAPAGSV